MIAISYSGEYEHRITPELLQIVRKEDNKIFYSVNRKTGEIVITYPIDKAIRMIGSVLASISGINRTMLLYCIPVTFSQKNSRPYVKYLGRFRSLFRPEIRFTVGEKALRRINRLIGMKVTDFAVRGRNDRPLIPNLTVRG
jgi:hypothetical protein